MIQTDPTVFISYRREETAGHAGRLHDAVAAQFGEDNVFLDVEIEPGVDFVKRITEAISRCRALIVVIGPRWAQPLDGRPAPRLADPGDFVRLEVETALNLPQVTVFPVLVGGARMPDPAQLPESLRPLTRRNALELSDLRWRYDSGRLIDALDELLGEGASPSTDVVPSGDASPGDAVPGTVRRSRIETLLPLLPLLLEGIGLAVAAGLLGHLFAEAVAGHAPRGTHHQADVVATIGRRALNWSIVAGALGAWLTLRRGDEHQRIAGRVLAGLALGALAGALGGVIFEMRQIASDLFDKTLEVDQDQLEVASLAMTGGLLGLAVGALWIPPRAFVGLLSGVAGGVLAQVLLNGPEKTPSDPVEVGVQCLAIFGFALVALLALDVRAASAETPASLGAAQPVPAGASSAGDR